MKDLLVTIVGARVCKPPNRVTGGVARGRDSVGVAGFDLFVSLGILFGVHGSFHFFLIRLGDQPYPFFFLFSTDVPISGLYSSLWFLRGMG